MVSPPYFRILAEVNAGATAVIEFMLYYKKRCRCTQNRRQKITP